MGQISTTDIAADAGIKKTQLEDSVQTSLEKADSAVQNFNSLTSSSTGSGTVVKGVSQTAGKVAVTMGQISTTDIAADAGITKTQLDSSVQTSLGKADSIADATKLVAGAGDGTYTLTLKVTNNQPEYKWEMIDRGN